MLDRAIPGYVPTIFKEKPALNKAFSDFVLYRNCVSFGGYTLLGMPALFGGYDYTPQAYQQRPNQSLVYKRNESMRVMPRLFSEAGWEVTAADLPGYGTAKQVFQSLPKVKALDIEGAYNAAFLAEHPEFTKRGNALMDNLIRFSFVKTAPMLWRLPLYDDGLYLNRKTRHTFSRNLGDYTTLEALPKITEVTDKPVNALNLFDSNMAHDPMFLQAPDYTLQAVVTNHGTGRFANDPTFHSNIGAILLLNKWFQFMQKNHVYDNTRIIIVSDHGFQVNEGPEFHDFPDKIKLPNGELLVSYTPLFLFKDFNAHGEIKTSDKFTTNADVPYMLVQGLDVSHSNPYNGKPFRLIGNHTAVVCTAHRFGEDQNYPNTFKVSKDEWLSVKDNVFDQKNWKQEPPDFTAKEDW
jgi:hypothetical protein